MSINAVEQISLICFELGKLERSKELMHPELSKLFELRAKVCQRHAINKMVAALHDKRQEKRRKQREIRVRQDNYYRALEYISDLQCSSDGLNLFSSQQILTLFNLMSSNTTGHPDMAFRVDTHATFWGKDIVRLQLLDKDKIEVILTSLCKILSDRYANQNAYEIEKTSFVMRIIYTANFIADFILLMPYKRFNFELAALLLEWLLAQLCFPFAKYGCFEAFCHHIKQTLYRA